MEKLIELLNEYEPYIQSDGTHTDNFWWYVSQGNSAVFQKEVGIDRIISNEYGFIKWLVYNDKIDKDKVKDKGGYVKMSRLIWDGSKDDVKKYWEYRLLILLAIQDEPIEFLISILK